MKILISNDDGYQAPGIAALAKAFAEAGHEVTVVAPDGQRSAASHSVTMYGPLVPRRVEMEHTVRAYAVNGTPADCVKLALRHLCPDVEFVLSGINRGYNAGADVLYSGTVAAAMEAALVGMPAMAVSNSYEMEETYPQAAQAALSAFELLKKRPLAPRTLLNVNYPAKKQALGMKIVPLCPSFHVDDYEKFVTGRVGDFYWMSDRGEDNRPMGNNDSSWLREGYVTLTVLQADMTDYEATQALQALL